MDSKGLEIYGFTSWVKLSELEKNNGEDIPEEPGVYVFILDEKFGRLKDESDILYIGSTDKLYRRLYTMYIKGGSDGTTERIHKCLYLKIPGDMRYLDKIKVNWVELENLKKLKGLYILIEELKSPEKTENSKEFRNRLIKKLKEELDIILKNRKKLTIEDLENPEKLKEKLKTEEDEELIKELYKLIIEGLKDPEILIEELKKN